MNKDFDAINVNKFINDYLDKFNEEPSYGQVAEFVFNQCREEKPERVTSDDYAELCYQNQAMREEIDKLLAENKRLRTALEKIKDNCQCETDDRDVCFYIATKALAIGDKGGE